MIATRVERPWRHLLLALLLCLSSQGCSSFEPRLFGIGFRNVGHHDVTGASMWYDTFFSSFGVQPKGADKIYGGPPFPGTSPIHTRWMSEGVPRCATLTLRLPLPPKQSPDDDYTILIFIHDQGPPTAGVRVWNVHHQTTYDYTDITNTSQFESCDGFGPGK